MYFPKTIKQVQNGLLTKEFSVVDLVNFYLSRIKKFDKNINSFITVTDDLAYEQAKHLDRLIKQEEFRKEILQDYPLLGAVVAHKDLFLTKGIRTTAGSKVLESYIPTYSATVVKRLHKAGCVMIGKTNLDAWAHGASGENSDFGATRNPWNKEYVPGGSSSGSAASVASDFSLIATGTDTGGSIRQPASFCNICSLKPTYGAVSRYGVIAMASSFDCVGHFAKTVEDIEQVFMVNRGEDKRDATVKNYRYQIPNLKQTQNSKYKIGVAKEFFEKGIDTEVKKTVLDVVGVLESLGMRVKEVSLPHTKYAISVYYIIMPAEVSSNLARYDAVRYGNDRNSFSDEAKRRIMLGSYVLSAGYYDAYYLKAAKVRTKIIEDFNKLFDPQSDPVDALVAPVSPTPPFKLGEKSKDPLKMYLSDVLTVSANVAGIPSLVMPAGFTKSGLPIGFQLMGPMFSENLLFEIGKKYQEVTNWHQKKPNLS